MDVLCLDTSARLTADFSRTSLDNPDLRLEDGLEFVTIRAASRMCSASQKTIDLWVRTGLWPLPCVACRNTCFFRRSDVEGWLATGTWPGGAHFQHQRGDKWET